MKYTEIAEYLGLNKKKDILSASVLNGILSETTAFDTGVFSSMLNGKEVIVFGASPSLKRDIAALAKFRKSRVFIAADGSTKALLEERITPDIVVSDLDGYIKSILIANENGAVVVLHAHGDNIEKIKEYAPKFRNVCGTHQIEDMQFSHLHNFGGFTDGDRCVALAEHFGAKTVYLAGMEFGKKIGEYAGTYERAFKLKKFEVAKKILRNFQEKYRNIINLSGK